MPKITFVQAEQQRIYNEIRWKCFRQTTFYDLFVTDHIDAVIWKDAQRFKPFTFFFFAHFKILNGFFGMFQKRFVKSLCALAKIRFEYTVSDENWIMYKVSELLESIRFISKATFQSIPSNSIETHWANSIQGCIFSFPTIPKICLFVFLIVLKCLCCLCVVEQVSRANS